MASSPSGAQLLLETIARGAASPRLLQEQNVSRRLEALSDAQLVEQAAELTRSLPSPKQELLELIVERRRGFDPARASLENGQQVFAKTCAACHQLDGKGPLIGPQLDGIGNRGLDRLLEDVLDPNRNVDVAFRTTTLVLTDGRIVSGLLRENPGTTLVLVDEKGQEIRVPQDEVEEQVPSRLSLMPENIATTLTEQELFDLTAWLLTKRGESVGLEQANDDQQSSEQAQ